MNIASRLGGPISYLLFIGGEQGILGKSAEIKEINGSDDLVTTDRHSHKGPRAADDQVQIAPALS